MLNEERKERILRQLEDSGRVLSAQLVQDLQVSEDTIRRDLKELAEAGMLKRVHGGALPVTRVIYQFSQREQVAPQAKATIAQKAAGYFADATRSGKSNPVVFIDGGTTTASIASYLPADFRATFITNCLPTAERLSRHPRLRVQLLGGCVAPDLLLTFGPHMIKEIENIQADLSLVSAEAIDIEFGISVSNQDDAMVKRAMISRSAESLVLAGSDKVGKASPYKVADLNEISYFVTDDGLTKVVAESLNKAGLKVI